MHTYYNFVYVTNGRALVDHYVDGFADLVILLLCMLKQSSVCSKLRILVVVCNIPINEVVGRYYGTVIMFTNVIQCIYLSIFFKVLTSFCKNKPSILKMLF